MIQLTFLLVTRVLTVIPMSIFIIRIIKRFRNNLRDIKLDKTAWGMSLVTIAMLFEGTLFGLYDIYKIVNFIPSQAPLWIIIVWCIIRLLTVLGIIILFSIMYEKNGEDKK